MFNQTTALQEGAHCALHRGLLDVGGGPMGGVGKQEQKYKNAIIQKFPTCKLPFRIWRRYFLGSRALDSRLVMWSQVFPQP